MTSETEISMILSQMDKPRHMSQHQQQSSPQHQGHPSLHHFHQNPTASSASFNNHQHQDFPPMPQSDIPVASTSSGHPQLIHHHEQHNNNNNNNSPQHPPLPPLPPNVSPGRSRASRAAKSAAQIMAGLQQQRGRETDNYISGLDGLGANGNDDEDDEDDGDDDVYEEDTAEAERDMAHDETMLAEEMLHMKNEGSQGSNNNNNNNSIPHQQMQHQHQHQHQQQLMSSHQDNDANSLLYDPSQHHHQQHHHQHLLQPSHYPQMPAPSIPGIINPPPMPEPERVDSPATPADGTGADDGSEGGDSASGGKNRPRGRKPKNQFGAGLQKDSSEYQKLRKENHKNVEKKRRETINDGIKRLSLLVPGADKNKSKIISQAAEYIAELKEAEHGYIEKWTLEKLMLEQNLRDTTLQNEELKRLIGDRDLRISQLESAALGMSSMNGNNPGGNGNMNNNNGGM